MDSGNRTEVLAWDRLVDFVFFFIEVLNTHRLAINHTAVTVTLKKKVLTNKMLACQNERISNAIKITQD